jgi:hypothetical protein
MPKDNLKIIAEHVAILNEEVGKLQIDIAQLKTSMKWTFRIIGYIAVLLTGIVIKSFF